MESLNIQEIVQKIIKAHAINLKDDQTEVQLIFDNERNHYLMMVVGWYDQRREYESLIHIDIKDNKIWIQSDGTEIGVAKELVEAGIPRQDIVLGYKSPFKRQFTEYAHL
ncbi:element excision factor XisI family protein [Coleofasciculus sp. G2-EDA-02]|uniref:element excision factor XisI family protein n=1 Tax=Coleofasciculus sp. G2-EDA-02 TaxID=3069529 RepID=UPI0032F2552A